MQGKERTLGSHLPPASVEHIEGDIRTTSQCTTSWYGDASLHFRHTRIEEDWKLEPSYMRQGAYDANQVCMNRVDGVPPPPCGSEGMLNSDA